MKHQPLVDSKMESSRSLANCENVFSPKLARQLLTGASSPQDPHNIAMIEVKQITEDEGSKCRESQTYSRSSIDDSNHAQCPDVYEKLIQDLEADVRKHIRVQQQLKLHIESVEDRVEELEMENDCLLKQIGQDSINHKKELELVNKNIEILRNEKKK